MIVQKTLLVTLVLILAVGLVTFNAYAKSDKQANADAKKTITGAIDKFVKGQWKGICFDGLSTNSNKTLKLAYSKDVSRCKIPVPPPPPEKQPPIGIITPSKLVANVSDTITLNANKSSDPDGQIVSYSWFSPSNVSLSKINGTETSFIFPNLTSVLVGLNITDNDNISITTTINITQWIANAEEPQLPPCPFGFHLDKDLICVPNEEPIPTTNFTKIVFTGDVEGTAVRDAIARQNPDYVIVAGDLGYDSTLSWFKAQYGDFGNKLKCLVGNHEAADEEGSTSLEKETIAFCKDHWSFVVGNTLVIGLNTNGDENTQLNYVKSLPVANYTNVIVVSHKNGHVFPNAHHPSEASALYKSIEGLGIKNLYEVGGHNHNLASADSKNWFISGAGGKSHYACGNNQDWNYCDSTRNGFLEFQITNNTIESQFLDTNNKILH